MIPQSAYARGGVVHPHSTKRQAELLLLVLGGLDELDELDELDVGGGYKMVRASLVALADPSETVVLNLSPFVDSLALKNTSVKFTTPGETELVKVEMEGPGMTSDHVEPPSFENSQRMAGEFVLDPAMEACPSMRISFPENNW